MDVRQAARRMAARPGWTLAAALSLALGIGANTAAFSVADALFLRPLPVRAPEEVAWVEAVAEGRRQEGFYFQEYRELRAAADAFAGMTAYSSRGAMLKRGGEAEMLPVYVVDGNLFEVLGIGAEAGRTLEPAENSSADGAPEVMISHSLWQRRFGGDAGIVSRQIQVNDAFVTVVGVVPAAVPGLERGYVVDLWESPAAWAATTNARSDIEERRSRQFAVVARVKPGDRERAAGQVAAMGRRLKAEYPATNRDIEFRMVMAREQQMSQAVKPVSILLAIVALVLWIACGNAAGLALAQAEARRRETGIRQALGATRSRLVRQWLTESALVAAAGAGTGLMLARWVVGALPALLPVSAFQLDYGFRLDARACGYALLATLGTVVLSGLAPALRASRAEVAPALRDGGGGGRQRSVSRTVMVVAQIGLAVVLLNAAGLLLRSFQRTRAESPGFDAARNLACLFMHTGRQAKGDQVTAVYERLRREAAALPGVRRATYCRRLPMSGSGGGATVKVEFPSLKLPEDQRRVGIRYNEVGPEYFAVLGTRILEGRAFSGEDRAGGARAVIVSAALAQRYFPGGGAVGQRVLVGGREAAVVGVAENARFNSIHEEPQPFVYIPFAQMPSGEATLMLESLREPGPLVGLAKKLVQREAPEAVVMSSVTLADHMKEVLFEDWVQAVLSSWLAGLGVALAAAGLFATVSYAVGRRMREFGVRMALGARRADVFGLVLKQSLWMAGAGIVLGLAGTLAASRVLRGMLYGVEPDDALTLACGAAAAAAVAVAASLAPAFQATRADAAECLRAE